MSYNRRNYPQFKDIHIFNVPGNNPLEIQQAIIDFLTDPAHVNYRFIDSHVNYFSWSCDRLNAIPADLWTSVAIIYTE